MSEKNPQNQDLENYLARLEKCLMSTSVSERAEIITEIRSHVLDAADRDPTQGVRGVLASLGEPEVVANRYLLERGLKPSKPPKGPVVKWLTIGFVSTFGIAVVAVLILLSMFTPLIKVDEKANRVVILGGVIDIDGDAGKIRIGDTNLHSDKEKGKFEGTKKITPSKHREFRIDMEVGKIKIAPSIDDRLSFECNYRGKLADHDLSESNGVVDLHIEASGGVDCNVKIPESLDLGVRVETGTVNVSDIKRSVSVEIETGELTFKPETKTKYKYDATVRTGTIESFDSSSSQNGVPVQFRIGVGKISKG